MAEPDLKEFNQDHDLEKDFAKAREVLPEFDKELAVLLAGSEYEKKEFEEYDKLRFIIARDYEPKASSKLFHEWVVWLDTEHPERIDEEELEPELKENKVFVHKTDKMGHPVIYGFPGRHDGYRKRPDLMRKHIQYVFTKAVEKMDKGKGVTQFVLIADFSNYGYKNMDPEAVKAILGVLNTKFAERFYRLYMINTGWFFWVIFKIVSPFIPPRTRAKIMFLRTKEEYAPIFAERFDPKDLLKVHGGEDEAEYQYIPGVQVCVLNPNAVVKPVVAPAGMLEARDHDVLNRTESGDES